jgi:hypothetical protein
MAGDFISQVQDCHIKIAFNGPRSQTRKENSTMTEKKDTIWIITQITEDDGSKSALPSFGHRIATKAFEISNHVLADHLEEFFSSFGTVLQSLPSNMAGFSVDEVELSLAINAKGGVELVGRADAELSTGLKFNLKRKANKPKQPTHNR